LALLDGRVGLALGMENGAPIEDDLSNLNHFFDRGVRYITLTHSKNNQICDSSYDDERRWNGLSPFGREVVAEMNRLGIMVDVSHVSDETYYQVIELSRAPVIASHSSCRHFTPGWERNMDDAMIRALGEKGGVIQINFGSGFLLHAAREQSTAFWAEYEEFRESNGLDEHDPRLAEFEQSYWRDHARIYADISDVVAHIDRVVELAGVDHVGLGSDFDGVGDSLPNGLKDVSYYPNLVGGLLESGYSEEDVEKICAGNLLRVWSEVQRVAEELRPARPGS
jgi:membrane dipeptidase